MKYKLIKYKTKLALTTRAMNCVLTFRKYIFGFKIGTKEVNVYLFDYVTWRDFLITGMSQLRKGSIIPQRLLK